jgi:hypothetical protein
MEHLDEDKIQKAISALETFLRPEIREIVSAARSGFSDEQYLVELPNPDTVDLTMEEISSLVVKTSNHYAKMARLNGMVKAQLKISEGRYKSIYKRAKVGRNEDEREANAIHAASMEHSDLTIVEAVNEIVDGLERAARVASESARKIYDRASAQYNAERRSFDHQ